MAQDSARTMGAQCTLRGMSRACLLAATLLGLSACGEDAPVVDDPPECNPLGGVGCVTPWPSSIYLRDDASSATGVRLDLAPGAMPISADDIELDVTRFANRTGFSPASQIFTVFPEGVDDANLPGHDDIAASLDADSPTVIVDLDTGERVAHWAELDANAADAIEEQALYLRPAARLAPGHRFAVAITRALKNRDGGDLAVPDGFRAILDGRVSAHARLEAIRPGYDAIFAALDDAGVDRDQLVVAWDFVTEDEGSVLDDTLAARAAALDAMGPLAANVTYEIVDDEAPTDDPDIARRILIDFEAPAVADDDGLIRGGDGHPIADGTHTARAVMMVPACATTSNHAGFLLFGHGFFGDLEEAQGSYLRRVARDLCMVVVGGEWFGMSTSDLSFAFGALNDGNQAIAFGERIVQGMVDFITLEQLVRGQLGPDLLPDLVDVDRTYFYGISQGAILGTTLFALDPFLTRGVFHVGGAEWGLLFERSTKWPTFQLALSGAYPGPLNGVIAQQLMQLGLDPIDPIHHAPHILADRFPGSPEKQFLLQIALGDSLVTNLSSYLEARTMDLPVLEPSLVVPYGLTETAGPLSSALVTYTEDLSPLPPETNLMNTVDNGSHGQLRKRAAVVEQIGTFLSTGEIVNTCTGACECAQGACGALDPP